jgi:hypothetical protein
MVRAATVGQAAGGGIRLRGRRDRPPKRRAKRSSKSVVILFEETPQIVLEAFVESGERLEIADGFGGFGERGGQAG